jgi:hypothetical protein
MTQATLPIKNRNVSIALSDSILTREPDFLIQFGPKKGASPEWRPQFLFLSQELGDVRDIYVPGSRGLEVFFLDGR